MIVLSHRGLDPDAADDLKESSLEAFQNLLQRGYSLEFDLQFTKDNDVIIYHETTLDRFTGDNSGKTIAEISTDEILSIESAGCHLTSLSGLFAIIETSPASGIH